MRVGDAIIKVGWVAVSDLPWNQVLRVITTSSSPTLDLVMAGSKRKRVNEQEALPAEMLDLHRDCRHKRAEITMQPARDLGVF